MTLAKRNSYNTLQGDTVSVRLADTFGLTITFSTCTGGGTATIPSLKMLNFECRVLSFESDRIYSQLKTQYSKLKRHLCRSSYFFAGAAAFAAVASVVPS